MATLTLTAAGAAAPELAWQRYVDPSLWSSWSPQISRVETTPPGARHLEAGMTGRVIGPLGVGVGFGVDDVDDAARRWSWRVALGPIRLRLGHAVAAHDGGCRTSLHLDGPLPVIAGYAPLAQLALHRLVSP